MASDWNIVSNQQSFIGRSIDHWWYCFFACLKAKSKHWTFAFMCFSMICNCHDFWSLHYCCYEQIEICFASRGRVRTAVRRGGQFCCSFVANLLRYLCAKNYEKFMRFDKVIAEIIRVQFFWPHTVDTIDTFQILLCIGDIQLIPNSKHCNTQQLCNKTAAQINVAQKVVVSHRQKYLQLPLSRQKKIPDFSRQMV